MDTLSVFGAKFRIFMADFFIPESYKLFRQAIEFVRPIIFDAMQYLVVGIAEIFNDTIGKKFDLQINTNDLTKKIESYKHSNAEELHAFSQYDPEKMEELSKRMGNKTVTVNLDKIVQIYTYV